MAARPLLSRLYHGIVDAIFGFDFFISYSWRDADQLGRSYALALKDRLTDQGFVCFLDSTDYEKGDDWQEAGRLALSKTRKLLLVATPAIFDSEPVLREIRLFRRTGRQIIPVDIAGTLNRAGLGNRLTELIPHTRLHVREPDPHPVHGPSEQVLSEIRASFKLARQRTIRSRVVALTMLLLGLLALQAELKRWEATRNAEIATQNSLRAEENAEVAKRNEAQARKALLEASRNLARAHEEKALGHLAEARVHPSDRLYQQVWLQALQAQRQPIGGEDGLRRDAVNALARGLLGKAFSRHWAFGPPSAEASRVHTVALVPGGGLIAVSRTGVAEHAPQELTRTGVPLPWTSISAATIAADRQSAAVGTADGRVAAVSRRPWEVRWEHQPFGSPVDAVAFSADGRLLVGTARDGPIRVWDARSGAEQKSVRKLRAGESHAVALSPDGALLAYADRAEVVLLDITSGKERLRQHLLEGLPRALVFSGDGTFLAAGSGPAGQPWGWQGDLFGGVHLWEAKTGVERWHRVSACGTVYALAVDGSGDRLVAGCEDGSIGLHASATGEELFRFAGHRAPVVALSFGEAGRVLASAGDDGALATWDIVTRAERLELDAPASAAYSIKVGFDVEGIPFRLEMDRGDVRCVDLATGSERWRIALDGRDIAGVAHTGTVRAVVLLTGDRSARRTRVEFWDADAVGVRELRVGRGGAASAVAVSPQGSHIAAGGFDGIVTLWEADSGFEPAPLADTGSEVRVLVFTPDGRYLAAGLEDGTVHLWELASRAEVAVVPSAGAPVQALAFAEGSRRIAVSSGNPRWDEPESKVRLIDVATANERWSKVGFAGVVTELAVHPNGRLVAALTSASDVYLWDLGDASERFAYRAGEIQANTLAMDPEGRLLLSGTVDGGLDVLDLRPLLLLENGPAPSARAALLSETLQKLWRMRFDGLDVVPPDPAPASAAEAGDTWPALPQSAPGVRAPGQPPPWTAAQPSDMAPLRDPPPPGRDKLDQVLSWIDGRLAGTARSNGQVVEMPERRPKPVIDR